MNTDKHKFYFLKITWIHWCGFGFLFVLISVLLPLVAKAQGASLYLFPSSGNYKVGSSFTISVKVDTGGVAINAAQGAILFDTTKLEVVNLSQNNSIFTLWAEEPTFSNLAGTIEFAGGLPHPGFTGPAGTILRITFKGKSSGLAGLTFSSGAVLASDGRGTNILSTIRGGNYNIQPFIITPPGEEIPEKPVPPTVGVPAAPVVSSPTHPDPDKWYSNNDPEFTWKLPPDVTKVSYAIDQNPTTDPKFVAETLIDKVSFTDLEDGIWYFHINFRNQYGWGKLTHQKVLIDTTPPLPFEIKVQREDPTDPQPILIFEAIDELSGIEYYEIKIGEGESFLVKEIKVESKLSPQAPGIHKIEVKAFDKAGNFTLATTEIEVLPIETPIITKYPKKINIGEKLILEGKSLPGVTILVFIREKEKEPEKEETKADGEGNWAFTSKPLEKGDYEVWVQAKDKRGALSLPSPKISFEVSLPPFLQFGKIAIDYLSTMITLIVLIVGALLIIFYSWYRISAWRRKLRVETRELAQTIYGAFRALREEVQEQIEYLDEKPGLTEGEKRMRDKLQEALNVSEEFIGKELKDIEKELK